VAALSLAFNEFVFTQRAATEGRPYILIPNFVETFLAKLSLSELDA
jgi:hypothetical protein